MQQQLIHSPCKSGHGWRQRFEPVPPQLRGSPAGSVRSGCPVTFFVIRPAAMLGGDGLPDPT